MKIQTRSIYLLCFCLLSTSCAKAANSTTQLPFVVEEVAQNLGLVWGMVFINENELLITEREGKIKILHIPTKKVYPVTGAPAVYAKGQGGLLDISLHPQFSQNKILYLSYAKVNGHKQSTAVAKAIINQTGFAHKVGDKDAAFEDSSPLRADKKHEDSNEISIKGKKIVQLQDIFIAQPFVDSSRHFGSRLLFDKKGFLYVTVGDRGNRHLAQKLDNHIGKILRLTEEGKAPADNPFVSHQGALPEIWSYGHRNPQGLFIHRETGQLWGQEHGPRGGDEINLIKKGKNYGWPVITYGKEYWGPSIGEGFTKQGMEQPVKYWTPSIAPSGLLIYSGKKFPQWKNHFFSGALVLRHLNRLEIIPSNQKDQRANVGKEERLLSHLNFRVRHVIEGPKGYIYLSVDAGKILKLKPREQSSLPQKK